MCADGTLSWLCPLPLKTSPRLTSLLVLGAEAHLAQWRARLASYTSHPDRKLDLTLALHLKDGCSFTEEPSLAVAPSWSRSPSSPADLSFARGSALYLPADDRPQGEDVQISDLSQEEEGTDLDL